MAVWNGSSGGDYYEAGSGTNTLAGGPGDDLIVAGSGENTIVYNLDEGIDTIHFPAPRSYQFAGFLAAAQMALDGELSGATYSSSYFYDADGGLIERLPESIRNTMYALRDSEGGTVPAGEARAAFEAMIAWINEPVSNVVEFGPGITLSSLTVQPGQMSVFGVPVIASVTVSPDQGVVLQMMPPDVVAPMPDGSPLPPVPAMDITFRFDDGSEATFADMLGQADEGYAGYREDGEAGSVLEGSLAGDQIIGMGGDDQIDGRAGDDALYGGDGNDVISGGVGYDLISGDAGDDVIAAGPGGGLLGGSSGNDTYLFNRGDGELTIDNTPGVVEGEVDTLSVGNGITPQGFGAYVDDWGNLVLFEPGSSDRVVVTWFTDGAGSDTRADQVIPHIQFVDDSGAVKVFDLAALVAAHRGQLVNASAAAPVFMFVGAEDTAFDLTDTPGAVAGGDHAVSYGTTGNLFDVPVDPPADQPPVVVSPIGDQSFNEGQVVSLDLASAFADPEAGPLNYSVQLANGSPLPGWLSFSPATGELSGTPDDAQIGSYAIRVTATDDGEQSASVTFNLTVAGVNDAPTVAAPIGDVSAAEDAALTISLAGAFADADAGDSLGFGFGGLPAWLQYDAQSNALVGTPANGDVGSYSITVTAADGSGATAQQTFSVSVQNVNDAPTVAAPIADQTATEDGAFSVSLAGLFLDADAGDGLSLAVSAPSWLAYDSSTGLLSGTPLNGDVGSAEVTVTATDMAGAQATYTFDVDVTNTNDAPTLAAGAADRTVAEDSVVTFSLPAEMFSDVDAGDALTLSASMADGTDLPAWIAFDAAAGTFTVAPGNDQVGTVSVQVTATDQSGAKVSDSFSLTVSNVNDAPVVAAPIADQAAVEDQAFSFTVPAGAFADMDSANLTLAATLADGSALPAWLDFDAASRTFSGMPGNAAVGSLSVRVTASDGSLSVSDVFDIAVENTNDAPEVAKECPDMAVRAGQSFSMTLPADAFRDIDVGDLLSYAIRMADGSPLPAWLTFDPATRTLSGVAPTVDPNARAAAMQFSLVATDRAGASATDVFALTIEPAPAEDEGQVLVGGNGNDRLTGGAGNDDLTGGRGRDVLDGGAGDDTLHFSRDDRWTGSAGRTNAGSPGYNGSGAWTSIGGKRQSQDVFIGGAGTDTLLGTARSDAVLLDDTRSGALQSGPRLSGIEVISTGAGDDVVDLTSRRYTYGDVTIDGGTGDDVLWSSSGKDMLFGADGNDRLDGGAGMDYLSGGSGNDALAGGYMEDIMQGGSGSDALYDNSPTASGVLDGGSGNDVLEDETGKSLFIGGRGDDELRLGGGNDIIAFNRGDGRDTVRSGNGGSGTLSLGGAIRIDELAFRRSGRDLVLEIGRNESITFDDWFRGRQYQAISTLQFVTEDMAGGSNRLRDDAVESFDMRRLAGAFESASRNPGVSRWALTNGLTAFQLAGSDTQAIGGDLAYVYGTAGSLAGIALGAAQEQVSSASFGGKQALHSLESISQGTVKLV